MAAVSTSSTRWSMRSTVVACGATSTRTGSLRKPWARPATSAGMVAEKSADCRRGCSAATIFRTGWMKPMSSMRSASSSTTKRVWSSRIERSSIRSVSRPGVATTTSTPRAIARTWAERDMPPRTSRVESRAPPAKVRKRPRSGPRARGSARGPAPGRSSAPAAPGQVEELVQDRQREGRGLAGAGLGDAEDVAAGELRRDRLGLDRRRRVEAGAGERVGERLGEAEVREGLNRHKVSFPRGRCRCGCRPRQAHVTKTDCWCDAGAVPHCAIAICPRP